MSLMASEKVPLQSRKPANVVWSQQVSRLPTEPDASLETHPSRPAPHIDFYIFVSIRSCLVS